MAEPHVVTALIAKYAELSGRKEACEKEAATIGEYLAHIQATLSLFKEGFDVTNIQPKQQYRRNPALKKGDIIRNVWEVLRTANEPLTSRELVIRVLRLKGIENPSEVEIQNARNSVGTCLKKKEKEGVVVSDGEHPQRWSIKPDYKEGG